MLDAVPSPAPQGTTLEAPKDNSNTHIASPPPAYAPPPTTNFQLHLHNMRLQRAQAQAAYCNNTSISPVHTVFRPLTTTNLSGHADEAEFEDDEQLLNDDTPRSAISLRINTSVNITQSNNIICLPETPAAEQANAIAQAVVKAIKDSSSAECGIPMIDGDGQPVPIKIEVDASMLVEGSGNIIGNAMVINEVIRQRGLRRSRQEDAEDVASPAKRRRNSTEYDNGI